jgi:hypothetical protein
MAGNQRVIYSIQAVGFAKLGESTFLPAHGVQSAPISTNYPLEDILELGQATAYQILEEVPDIQMTVTKVLDGYPMLTHLATNGALSGSIQGRGNVRTTVALSIFQDTQENASGTPVTQTECSGMYWNGTTITVPVDGNCTEEINLVGNNKIFRTGSFTFAGATLNSVFNGTDAPSYGSVMRRQHVDFNAGATLLPTSLPGISSSGTNDAFADGNFPCSVQNFSVSFDCGRENINELGHKGLYFKTINPAIDVTTTIDIVNKSGDMNQATEAGILGVGNNTSYETIQLTLLDSTVINVGSRNKLQSVTNNGGDTGGGFGTIQYTYRNKNYCIISHSGDPSGL